MRVNKYLLAIGVSFVSLASLAYASWQYNGGDLFSYGGSVGVTNRWHLNVSMNTKGGIYDGDRYIGHVVYEGDNENQLAGGSVTSDFVYLDNNDVAVHNYLANQLGSDINVFKNQEVDVYLPKAIYNETTEEELPIAGIDHLGTYTTIGGPLYRRFVTFHIPDSYTFIGNYAFYLTGSDHADSYIQYNIPSSVTYIGHEAFNFSTLNHMKSMWDQKYKFRVNYEGTAKEFITLINNSKKIYEKNYVGVKKEEMEAKAKLFQNEVDDTGGIIYSGSKEYSWFFRPAGQEKSTLNSDYWPAQYDYIDVYCATNPDTGKQEVVRYTAHSPIAEECKKEIAHYKEPSTPTSVEPIIIEL